MRAHLSTDGARTLADLAGLSEIDVDFGGPQPVDGAASPPTIGSAVIIDADNSADGGIVHVIDTALDPQP